MKTITTRFYAYIMLMMVLSVKSYAQTPTVLWTEGNHTLYFLYTTKEYKAGDSYDGQTVTEVYMGDDDFIVTKHFVDHYDWGDNEYDADVALWYDVAQVVEQVVFDSSFKNFRPKSTYRWFYDCSSLKSIDGIENLNTADVTNMGLMFLGCSALQSLDLSSFDTGNVTDMESMFSGCSGLQSLDLSSFDTGNVTDMECMFLNCSGLQSLNVSSFDTGKVADMISMFNRCSSLQTLDLSNFNTANVTNMRRMFSECSSLQLLDVSHFDTGNVTEMSYMFARCSGLQSLNVSNFRTGNVTDMANMFSYCSSLTTLDVSNFNTERVENMRALFYKCSSLQTLDVSHFDTDNVSNMGSMFAFCHSLETIFCNDTWKAENSDLMFYGCKNLVGASSYDSDMIIDDISMANPDTGYFTRKESKKGDVNLDGNVDISDIVAVINHIAGSARYANADVNSDKHVDISDIVAIINIIASGDAGGEDDEPASEELYEKINTDVTLDHISDCVGSYYIFEKSNLGNYYLALFAAEHDDYGFTGPGFSLAIDLYTDYAEKPDLSQLNTTFNFAEEGKLSAWTFREGTVTKSESSSNPAWNGTYLDEIVEKTENGRKYYDYGGSSMVTGGTIKATSDGKNVRFVLDLTTETGHKVTGTFYGPVKVSVPSDNVINAVKARRPTRVHL